jgi:magnesium-protoporphyrin O-methyltransferase
MVAFLEQQGLEGTSVLEIGGGVGDIQVELLRRGAAHATNLELSAAYDDEAERLLERAGLRGRVTRRLVDIAATPDDVQPADVVVLHRVVCCYPDYERLLTAAATHSRRLLVFSHPGRNAATRLAVAMQNAGFRLTGRSFRTFSHPPGAMVDVLARHGLAPVFTGRVGWWRVVGLARSSSQR